MVTMPSSSASSFMISFSLASVTIFSVISIGECGALLKMPMRPLYPVPLQCRHPFGLQRLRMSLGISIFAFGDMRERISLREFDVSSAGSVRILCIGAEIRTRRWAMNAFTALGMVLGRTPISTRRATLLPAALLVWSVRGANEVTGETGVHGDVGSLVVANFSDEYHVGILANNGSKPHGERVVSASRHLRLGNVRFRIRSGLGWVTMLPFRSSKLSG